MAEFVSAVRSSGSKAIADQKSRVWSSPIMIMAKPRKISCETTLRAGFIAGVSGVMGSTFYDQMKNKP